MNKFILGLNCFHADSSACIISGKKLTGVPILINTSLNENEPIVCSPKQAFELLLRTKLDYLIISNFIFKKK